MPENHLLARILRSSDYVACCSCGWRTAPARSREHAERRWRIHVGERQANAWTLEAARLASMSRIRSAELADLRAATQLRRRALSERRMRMQRAGSVGPVPAGGPGDRRGSQLDRARELAGISLAELWPDYLALGGGADLEQLGEMLAGRRPLRRLDHDVIALLLNERFAEAGFGHPVEYWEDTVTAARAATRTSAG